MEANENTPSDDEDGKAAGIVSYFFIVGWIIAYFALHHSKTGLGSYQLRQTLLFHLISTVAVVALDIIFFYLLFSPDYWVASALNWLTRTAIIALWVFGFLGAINGQKTPMPLIGKKAQRMFSGI
ncbi:MAG: hypothetical protein JO080_17090 [Mucilaginibacter sp.]|nr:hypothetical protein [Mucilaginibacter sp.]